MKKQLMAAAMMLGCVAGHAVELNFSRITGNEEGFRQFWQLEPQEMKRYQAYMEVVGKYRHQNTDPLTVLAIIADSPEDRLVYAGRAAEFEHHMVKREIETAWHISEAMSVERLRDDMTQMTDRLIGIDTTNYNADGRDITWMEGDKLVLVLDELCLEEDCVEKFGAMLEAVPAEAPRQLIMMGRKPLSATAEGMVKAWDMEMNLFDPIEHAGLKGHANRVLLMRDGRVLTPLTALTRIILPTP